MAESDEDWSEEEELWGEYEEEEEEELEEADGCACANICLTLLVLPLWTVGAAWGVLLIGKLLCSWLCGRAWGLWHRAAAAAWRGMLFWGITVPAMLWTRGAIRAQKAGREMLFAAETGARQAREEEEELEVADEEEEGEGGSAQRQRADRGKGRGMSSKKRATSIAGRRRRATSAKQQNRVYDPGITG